MWIEMTGTYVGANGMFPKGQKFDLAPDIVKQLPKDSFKKIRPPWDEHKDVKAIAKAKRKSKAKDAQVWADALQGKADDARKKADELVAGVSEKQTEVQKTEQAAKEAIAKANKAAEHAKEHPSENNMAKATALKATAYQLAMQHERKDYEFQIAHSELVAAIARAGLKQLEANDAKRNAKAAAKKAGIEQSEIDESVDKQIDESVDGQIDESVDKQIDGVAEGQTVPAGQES